MRCLLNDGLHSVTQQMQLLPYEMASHIGSIQISYRPGSEYQVTERFGGVGPIGTEVA
jgi:hypothetical protein